jgi:hypothetical protein
MRVLELLVFLVVWVLGACVFDAALHAALQHPPSLRVALQILTIVLGATIGLPAALLWYVSKLNVINMVCMTYISGALLYTNPLVRLRT